MKKKHKIVSIAAELLVFENHEQLVLEIFFEKKNGICITTILKRVNFIP